MFLIYILVAAFLVAFFYALYKDWKNNKVDIFVNGRKYTVDTRKVRVSKEYISKLDSLYREAHAENEIWDWQYLELRKFCDDGASCEKNGDIDNAISAYVKAVNYGRSASKLNWCNYAVVAWRLAILYRKKKCYDKEIETIKQALKENLSEKDRETWKNRLQKAEMLKSKNDKK